MVQVSYHSVTPFISKGLGRIAGMSRVAGMLKALKREKLLEVQNGFYSVGTFPTLASVPLRAEGRFI